MDFSRIFSGIGDTLSAAFSAQNIPFFILVFVLGILGTYFSKKVWTRERAYKTTNPKTRMLWKIFRDSQVLHPMFAGAIWMALWRDPMGYGWDVKDDLNYGFLAGAISLFPWVALKIYLKRNHKIDIEELLPGLKANSVRPETTKAAAEVEQIPSQKLPSDAKASDVLEENDALIDAVHDSITPPGME